MMVVHGTKVVRKQLGRRADFCLLCRDFRPIRVAEVQSVRHVYLIPLGPRRVHGFEETCEGCGLVLRSADEPGGAPTLSMDRHADVETLLTETNPDARRARAGRLSVEARIRAGGLPRDERPGVLLESFLPADRLLKNRASETPIDASSGLGCLGTVAAFVLTMAIGSNVFHAKEGTTAGAAVGVAAVLGVLTIILIATDERRFARRSILPVLARAVRPLRPAPEEVEQALSSLNARGGRLGRLLRPSQVIDAMSFAAE